MPHEATRATLVGIFVQMMPTPQNAKALFLFQSPPLQYDHHDLAAQKSLLLDAFKDERGWQVPRLLTEMASAQDFYFSRAGWFGKRTAICVRFRRFSIREFATLQP
jgi:hypothetical protein